MLRGPSRPMEEVTEDKAFRCYTAPGETFATEAEMKAHYHTELHRFNLKRKVAGLAPLTRAQFEALSDVVRELRTRQSVEASAEEDRMRMLANATVLASTLALGKELAMGVGPLLESGAAGVVLGQMRGVARPAE